MRLHIWDFQMRRFGVVEFLSCFLLLGLRVQGEAYGLVSVTPWCRSSFRVQVAPPGSPYPLTPVPVDGEALLRNCVPNPGPTTPLPIGQSQTNGALRVTVDNYGQIYFDRVTDKGTSHLFSTLPQWSNSSHGAEYMEVKMVTQLALQVTEDVYGLGQGGWAGPEASGCPGGPQQVVPLLRNNQSLSLLQRKFHVSIPWIYSSLGYGLLFNQPGYGSVSIGVDGGSTWTAEATHVLDFWVTVSSDTEIGKQPQEVYSQYADATGHAPLLPERERMFWQSRNRYKTSSIAQDIAQRYSQLPNLHVGVLVVDYHNQAVDGDFEPDAHCFPSLSNLTSSIRELINASTAFSFWPEAQSNALEYDALRSAGCLCNTTDLGGIAIDPTASHCRSLMWNKWIKPRYVDQGVSIFWLDETDGEGTPGGDGTHGYDTSLGPAFYTSNLWVNNWLSTFAQPDTITGVTPTLLVRGLWAGAARYGAVLWSSDIWSTFEELRAQINLGVHASLSGIPWWTSDVGGYGCGMSYPNDSPYMQELIVRWYQFGVFSPVFRTHGCRSGADPEPLPSSSPCERFPSCGANEIWSYGADTQATLERLVELRYKLLPYISEMAENVTANGGPTVRPLWWEFPSDTQVRGIDDQYLFGPDYLVAPVVAQGATNRSVYLPQGARWQNIWTQDVLEGGQRIVADAPLQIIPVYLRV